MSTWEPDRPRHAAPAHVRQALDHLAATMGLDSVEAATQLFLSWPTVVGDDLATRCRPKAINEGVLTIEAFDQQWATELSWMTNLIVERCADALGEPIVTEVRVVRGSPATGS